jgi:hypothetical protein
MKIINKIFENKHPNGFVDRNVTSNGKLKTNFEPI